MDNKLHMIIQKRMAITEKECYENIAYLLRHHLYLENIALRIICDADFLEEPRIIYCPESFDESLRVAVMNQTEEKEDYLYLKEMIEAHKDNIEAVKEPLVKEFNNMLKEVWESVCKDSNNKTSAIGERFHVLYNVTKGEEEGERCHTIEIFLTLPELFDDYSYVSLTWYDDGEDVLGGVVNLRYNKR